MSQGVHVSLCNNVTILSVLRLSYILGHENKEGTAIKTVVIITYICKEVVCL